LESSSSTSGEATSTGTVDRVALLLRVLAEAEADATVAQVAERMKLPASTAHRLLGLLVNTGLAERGHRPGSYRVGLEFLRLGGLVVSRTEVTAVAQAFMQRVADATGETCALNLYLPQEQKGMIAAVVHGSHPLRYETQLYRVMSLCFGATGRGVLAFLPNDVITQILARQEVSPMTGLPISDPQGLRCDIAEIVARGYAISKAQRIAGAVGLAAPVFKGTGVIVGALCITLPGARFQDAKEASLAGVLVEQAAKLSLAMGYVQRPT